MKDRVVWSGLDFDRGLGIEKNVYAALRIAKLPRCENKSVESKTVLISKSLFKTCDGQAPVKEIFFLMQKCLF